MASQCMDNWAGQDWAGVANGPREGAQGIPSGAAMSPQGEIFENVHEFATQEMLSHP